MLRNSLQASISCSNFNTLNCPTSRFEIPYQRPVNEYNASNDMSCTFGTGVIQGGDGQVKCGYITLSKYGR